MKTILILISLLSSSLCLAQNFKIRAREHYEKHEVKNPSKSDTYSGLSSTINAWWEVPYQYSIGFSFSPVFSAIREDNANSFLEEKIIQQNIGLEYKVFPKLIVNTLFLRLGAGYSKLETNIVDNKTFYGNYTYFGVGNEIPFNSFGFALELAYRYANYNDRLSITTLTPSVGFHFYKKL